MQDRYFGDIGDFAKYGLLRAVTAGEPPLRLAVLWYLVPDESHNKDGRHIDYLEPTPENLARFRACDPELYDRLGDLVRAGAAQRLRRPGAHRCCRREPSTTPRRSTTRRFPRRIGRRCARTG